MEGRTRSLIGLFVVIAVIMAVLLTIPPSDYYVERINWIEFQHDTDNTLFISRPEDLSMWDTNSGHRLKIREFGASISCFSVSNGGFIAIGTNDARIVFLDGETLETFDTFNVDSNVISLDWSDGSGRLIAVSEARIKVWDDGEIILDIPKSSRYFYYSCISWDGKTIAIGGPAGLIVLNVSDPDDPLLHISEYTTKCEFSPNGDLAVGFWDGPVKVFDHETWGTTVTKEMLDGYKCVDWSSDGSRFYASGRGFNLKVWSYPEGKLLKKHESGENRPWYVDVGKDSVAVSSVHFHYEGEALILENHIHLYDLDGNPNLIFPPLSKVPMLLPFSIVGFSVLIVFLLQSEYSRRQFLKKTEALFIENVLSMDEKSILIYILLMIMFVFFNVVFNFKSTLDINRLFGLIALIMSIMTFFRVEGQVVMDNECISLPTNAYQSIIKKKPLVVYFKDIIRINPYFNVYKYSKNKLGINSKGVILLTKDYNKQEILFPNTETDNNFNEFKKAMFNVLGDQRDTIYSMEPMTNEDLKEKRKGQIIEKE